jgi:type VI protein secretion system component Hcp
MAIYLKIPEVSGSVTTKNYENWIELAGMNFVAKRSIAQRIGHQQNREPGIPYIGELELSKYPDKASSKIQTQLLQGKSWSECKIVVGNGTDTIKPFIQYTLHDVMVSHYEESILPHAEHNGSEFVKLSFTKVETFTPYNSQGMAQSPFVVGYNLATAQAM